MRRLTPSIASLLAVLLLGLWTTGASTCLAAMRFDPAQTRCNPLEPPNPTQPTHHHPPATCPLCAPLPPALVTAPTPLPPPRPILLALATQSPIPPPPTLAPHPTPLQPRAPPAPV